jgi:selenocysteine-specific elongation factor
MYVIGTAGHVDHGKSTLVEALTGINPDRLAEEQRREMTIDLGFAWLTLPSGKSMSIVDVPGHERFIKNMLAGVGGIDAALLIVAADEGIMPQTLEHLHILDLLEVEHGLVVLTKIDMVDDEWLGLMQEELRERLAESVFANAQIVPVSARRGDGMHELKQALDQLLLATPSRATERGAARLPVDRIFTIGGFGTIVTGTLLDGPLAVGDEVEIAPHGLTGRVRGLQTHGTKIDRALPGTRVAVNIAGVAVADVHRGDVVTLPGAIEPTALLDLKLRVVMDAPRALEQNDALDLFVGATEVGCHITLLDADALRPGQEGWVQLRLERPIAVARGDRSIVRVPSPSLTVGGGRITEPHPRRHRRFRSDVVEHLETLARGAPAELLAQAAGITGPIEWSTLRRLSGLPLADVSAALDEALRLDHLRRLDGNDRAISDDLLLITPGAWEQLTATIGTLLSAFHTRNPLRAGMPREELKSKLGIRAPRVFNQALQLAATEGLLIAHDTVVHQPSFAPRLTSVQQREVNSLLAAFSASPYSPPPRSEWEQTDGILITFLLESGQLVRVSSDVLFGAEGYTKLVEWTVHVLDQGGEITIATLRDHFATSRKYAQALLEHLDERKITRRVGDVRQKY